MVDFSDLGPSSQGSIDFSDLGPSQQSGYQGTWLENTAPKIQKVVNAVGSFGAPKGPYNEEGFQGNEPFEKAGSAIAEKLERAGVNPYVAAIPATAVSMMNPENWMVPETEGIEANPLAPTVPVGRQAGVAAAQQAGVPLTRAEMSGSMPAARLESFLQKTPLGSKPIQNFRNVQADAISQMTQKAQGQFGTAETPTMSGMEAKEALTNEQGVNAGLSRQLYSNVPDVQLPLPTLQKTAQDIIGEQGKLPTSSQNPQIVQMASDYTNMGSPGYAGAPPSFQVMNKIRSDLGDLMNNGSGTDRMYAYRMQSALDQDLNNFGANNPEGPEFGTTFSRAQGFYRDMTQLKNNPLVKKLQGASPQDMSDMVFKAGDPQKVLTAQAALGDEGFQPLKRQFFSDLITDPNLPKKLSSYTPDFLSTVFNPNEQKALQSAASIKQLQLGAEKLAGNPSGTGQTVGSGISYGAAGDLLLHGHPLEAAGIMGTPYLAAKAYLSPMMTKGIPIRVGPTLTRDALTAAMAGLGSQQSQ